MSRGDFGYGATTGGAGRSQGAYRDSPYGFGGNADRPGGGTESQQGATELADQISSNIFTINTNAATLEKAVRQIGTDTDSAQLRDRIHSTEQTTNDVTNSTAKDLRRLSTLCTGAQRQQRIQYERLTQEFREAVKRYNTLQKKVAEKVKSAVVLSSQGKKKAGPLIDWSETTSDEANLVEQEERRQQLQAQEEIVDSDLALIAEREEQIQQLEGDILDINDIFRDLGTLVHEQGETIDTIEANVEKASSNVESGAGQLQTAAQYQRKARKKMCILVVVLLVIAAIITLIIVLSVKH